VALLPDAMRQAVVIVADKRSEEQKKLAEQAKPLLKITWDEVVNNLNDKDLAERKKLKARIAELNKTKPAPLPTAWAIGETNDPKPVTVLKRGDYRRPTEPIKPGYLQAVPSKRDAKTRIDLADEITDAKHPLTARVVVNRLWQQHFGRGIVATANDFGTRGDAPTHPQLLDALAWELMHPVAGEPWQLKRLHKLMVMTDTYQQVSDFDPASPGAKADPDNKLLWRMNRRRLEGEAIRDAMLTVSGTLNRDVGGPSVKVPLEQEVYDLIFSEDEPDNLWPVTPDTKQHTRRSLYLFAKRNVRQPLLEAFDQPDTLGPCAARGVSTFAPQALILMNGPLAHEQAKAFADSLRKSSSDTDGLLKEAYRRCFSRVPSAVESEKLQAFLKKQPGADPLADVCRALFNLNEFVYVK
jgi:Protein of unknown function (DUF1553)